MKFRGLLQLEQWRRAHTVREVTCAAGSTPASSPTDVFSTLDSCGRFTHAGVALSALLGHDCTALIGRLAEELLTQPLSAIQRRRLAVSLRRGETVRIDFQLADQSGLERMIDVR